VCGCEGTVAGKGSHTLAFVGWVFHFLFCLYAAKIFLSFCRLFLSFYNERQRNSILSIVNAKFNNVLKL
jgi:predicted membrane protein